MVLARARSGTIRSVETTVDPVPLIGDGYRSFRVTIGIHALHIRSRQPGLAHADLPLNVPSAIVSAACTSVGEHTTRPRKELADAYVKTRGEKVANRYGARALP